MTAWIDHVIPVDAFYMECWHQAHAIYTYIYTYIHTYIYMCMCVHASAPHVTWQQSRLPDAPCMRIWSTKHLTTACRVVHPFFEGSILLAFFKPPRAHTHTRAFNSHRLVACAADNRSFRPPPMRPVSYEHLHNPSCMSVCVCLQSCCMPASWRQRCRLRPRLTYTHARTALQHPSRRLIRIGFSTPKHS